MRQHCSFEERARQYWVYFAVGLFLVVVLDLFTTIVATAQYGVAVESNPLMRWLLLQGPAVVAAAHIVVVLVVVSLFSRVIQAARGASTSTARRLETAIRLLLGAMITVGVVVVTNNVVVIVLGHSLL